MDMTSFMLAFLVGSCASVLGGATGGVIVGGRQIGKEIALMMGSFYGPLAGVGGVLVGLAILAFAPA